MRNWYFVISILIVSLLLFAFVAPGVINSGIDFVNNKTNLGIPRMFVVPFRLGLDLLGGTHLVYQADLSKISGISSSDAMQGVKDVIERRVNFFGVAEPLVQISGQDRIIIELAGISDVNEAIKLIGETPFLEFREEKEDIKEIINAQAQGERLDEDPFTPTGLSGKHLERAQVAFDPQTSRPQVQLSLNEEGGKLFAEVTRRNVGKILAIYLDGIPISVPVVQTEISNGVAVITGKFTPQEARLLATRLNSGALPVPITLISQQTIGASLGAVSLAKSLRVGIYGILSVALFMILFYRLPGFVSVLALGVYTLIVLTVYKLLPVTLTLSGMAGFVLSLGIAVDANILIFARMKEELRAGKTIAQSIREGFRRAWLSIRDGHITTLIGAFILYMFTTSMVKGFALTLGIGVFTSLFTATIITRMFLNAWIRPSIERFRWLFN